MDLLDLWLPILLSAVFVFIASSVIHIATPMHKKDYDKLPNEATVLEGIRGQGVQPGQYMFPHCAEMKEMGTPEMIEKLNQGPVGFINVMPNGPFNMTKSLTQWLIYSILIGVFVAYIATLGGDAIPVFRLTSAAAILGYGTASIPESIWKGACWGVTAKFVIEGIIYGLVTGATFAWLWPVAI